MAQTKKDRIIDALLEENECIGAENDILRRNNKRLKKALDAIINKHLTFNEWLEFINPKRIIKKPKRNKFKEMKITQYKQSIGEPLTNIDDIAKKIMETSLLTDQVTIDISKKGVIII